MSLFWHMQNAGFLMTRLTFVSRASLLCITQRLLCVFLCGQTFCHLSAKLQIILPHQHILIEGSNMIFPREVPREVLKTEGVTFPMELANVNK